MRRDQACRCPVRDLPSRSMGSRKNPSAISWNAADHSIEVVHRHDQLDGEGLRRRVKEREALDGGRRLRVGRRHRRELQHGEAAPVETGGLDRLCAGRLQERPAATLRYFVPVPPAEQARLQGEHVGGQQQARGEAAGDALDGRVPGREEGGCGDLRGHTHAPRRAQPRVGRVVGVGDQSVVVGDAEAVVKGAIGDDRHSVSSLAGGPQCT